MPLLTRIYAPADFGVMAFYTSLLQLFFPLMSLGYVMAVTLPKREELARSMLGMCALIIIAATAVLGIVLVPIRESLFTAFSTEVLSPWWWLVLIGLPLAAFAELLSAWATRRRAYGLIAKNAITNSIVSEGVKVFLGAVGLRPFGLLFGQLLSQCAGVTTFTRAFAKDLARVPSAMTVKRLKFLARYYSSFPAFRLPSQFLLMFAMQSPLLYTARLYGIETAGQLALAFAVLAAPTRLIGGAIARAYYAEISQLGRSRAREVFATTKKVQFHLFLIGLLPAGLLLAFGEELFVFAFGQHWQPAGHYAAILAIYVYWQFTSSPLMELFNVFKLLHVQLVFNVIRVAMLLCLFWAAAHLGISAERYVTIYGILMSVFYAINTAFVFAFVWRFKHLRERYR